jgi:hypothetical protein
MSSTLYKHYAKMAQRKKKKNNSFNNGQFKYEMQTFNKETGLPTELLRRLTRMQNRTRSRSRSYRSRRSGIRGGSKTKKY